MFLLILSIVVLLASAILGIFRKEIFQSGTVLPSVGLGIVAFLLFAGSFIRVVPANSVGIPVTFGSVGGEMSPGPKVVLPVTEIRTFSTRLQELTMVDEDSGDDKDAIEVRGSEGYAMRVDVTVRYRVLEDSAVPLFRRVGSMEGIRDRIVRPEVRESVRVVFAEYTAEDGYSAKRPEISGKINDDMRKRLSTYGLELDAVLVRNVNPDETLKQAISARSAARERSLQAELEQKKQITEAETRKEVAERDASASVTKAEGEAKVKGIAAQAEADSNIKISSSLTPALIEFERIRALTTANTIYIPLDSNLFIAK